MIEINFLPDYIKLKRSRNERIRIIIIVMFIIIAYTILFTLHLVNKLNRYKKEEKNISEYYNNLSSYSRNYEINDLREKINICSEYTRVLKVFIGTEINIPLEINRIKSNMPVDFELLAIKYTNSEVKLSILCTDYNSADHFIRKLQAVELYKNIRINKLNVISQNAMNNTLGMELEVTIFL